MGCFLACFGSSKNRKRRKPANKVLPRHQIHGSYKPLQSTDSLKQEITENPISPVPESREKIEEQLSLGTKKKVTFDLTVKAYEEVSEITNYLSQSEDEDEKGKEEDEIVKQTRSTSLSEDSSNSSSLGSFPSNHRYGNCRNSDDEYEDTESDESDLEDDDNDDDDDDDYYEDDDDDDVDHRLGEPESSESFFSLPVESRTSATPVAEKEVNSPLKTNDSLDQEKKTLGSNRNARDRSQYVHSVLNPVENLTQWKAVKVKTPSPLTHQTKENINLETELKIPFSAEPTFKPSPFSFNPSIDQSSPPKQEIAVDASLSTWLGSSESTPSIKSSNISIGTGSVEVNKSPRSSSPRSHEDRPILGALTLEELKQFSASSSPRKSPTHSPDEIPILGTVGSYWSHSNQAMDSSSGSSCKGIPNTTSKYREDKRVNWHSTPFETRLERALKKNAAEAYTSY